MRNNLKESLRNSRDRSTEKRNQKTSEKKKTLRIRSKKYWKSERKKVANLSEKTKRKIEKKSIKQLTEAAGKDIATGPAVKGKRSTGPGLSRAEPDGTSISFCIRFGPITFQHIFCFCATKVWQCPPEREKTCVKS